MSDKDTPLERAKTILKKYMAEKSLFDMMVSEGGLDAFIKALEDFDFWYKVDDGLIYVRIDNPFPATSGRYPFLFAKLQANQLNRAKFGYTFKSLDALEFSPIQSEVKIANGARVLTDAVWVITEAIRLGRVNKDVQIPNITGCGEFTPAIILLNNLRDAEKDEK